MTSPQQVTFTIATDYGENYLSGDYQRINTLLRAMSAVVPGKAHLNVGWVMIDETAVAIAPEWVRQAQAAGTLVEDPEQWGSEEMREFWERVISIRERWDIAYPTRGDALVWRGDSPYFLNSPGYAELAAAAAQPGGATIQWKTFLSTTYTAAPQNHNYISQKSVLWRISLSDGHPGRVIGNNNPSEGELTFDVETPILVTAVRTVAKGSAQVDIGGGVMTVFPLATAIIEAKIGPDPRHPSTLKKTSAVMPATVGGPPAPPPPPAPGAGRRARALTVEERNKATATALIAEHKRTAPDGPARHAFFMMGGPGSGKSRVWEARYAHVFPNALKIDPDTFKTVGADHNLQHADSKETAKAVLAEAVRQEISFVYDSTGSDTTLYRDAMQACKSAGWKVSLIVVFAPPALALSRVNNRAAEDASRQVISADVVKNTNDAVYKSFTILLLDQEIRQLVNDVELWSNDTDSAVPASSEWTWVSTGKDPTLTPEAGITVLSRLRAG